MALLRRGEHAYGEDRADLEAEVIDYGRRLRYPPTRFAHPVCGCGNQWFQLLSDETVCAVQRRCAKCGNQQWMGDSATYADRAELEPHACLCADDADVFELAPALHLYAGSNDVRWLNVGCRCPACGLLGVYVDYKCEAGDADAFLANCCGQAHPRRRLPRVSMAIRIRPATAGRSRTSPDQGCTPQAAVPQPKWFPR